MALVEHRPQAAAAEELGDEEGHVVLAPVVDGQHVGVVEAGGDLGLGLEPAEERRVVGEARVQHLDRHPAPQADVLGQEHLGRGAGPDGGQEAVAAREHTTDLVGHAGQWTRMRGYGLAPDPTGGSPPGADTLCGRVPPRCVASSPVIVVAVALAAVAFACTEIAPTTGPTTSPSAGDEPGRAAHPAPEAAQILRQAAVGVDLASGWTGVLQVNGVEIPEDQAR